MTAPAALGRMIRPRAVIERNFLSWRHNWWVLLSGVFEPIFYLLGMGLGLGGLVGDITLQGRPIAYATFVAAGLLASSAMSGALFDATFNFYFKLREAKVFDAMLNAPLRMQDVMAGELMWAVGRGAIYSTIFLLITLAFGAVSSWWALLSLPACILIALTFSALGAFGTTFIRTWQDFDLIQLVVLPMTMGSTTFFPLAVYPEWAHPIVQATPLYNGVALVRDLNTGLVGWHDLGHVLYLIALGVLAGWATSRRLDRLLRS